MAETTSATTKSSSKSESSLLSRLAFGALGLILAGIVFVYVVLYFGSVRGDEFSPDSFQRRGFSYLELPLIGVQITPINHTNTTNDLEKYLAAQKLFPTPTKPENRWDLVLAGKGLRNTTQGDARILCMYLDATDEDGDSIWLKWSEEHVEMAKIVWPAVAKLARQELYSLIPELFVLARSANTPEQLQQKIDQSLADNYLLIAETLEALQQNDIAAELFAEVVHHAPDRAELVRGRNKSGDSKAMKLSGDEPSDERDAAQ